MRRSLRRAATLLLAAGALGVGNLAHAQAVPEVSSAARARPTPGQSELERMKVELAWLADPTCFAHRLEARVAGTTLEVRGTVPDEQAHQHALRVARQNCFLPVVDTISLATAAPTKPCSAEQLRQLAIRHLVRTFGQRAAGFDVQTEADGKICIGGSVVSFEDKVQVSRCLRAVPGCTCVYNTLSVMPTTHAGQTVTLVSTDGKHMVRGALPAAVMKPSLIQQAGASMMDDGEPALPRVMGTAPAAPAATLPSGLPPVRPGAPAQPTSYNWYAGQGTTVVSTTGYGGECPHCVMQPMEKGPRFPLLSRIKESLSSSSSTPAPMPSAPAPMPVVQSSSSYWPPAHASGYAATTPAPRQMPIMPVSASQEARLVPQTAMGGDPVSAMRLQQLVHNACGPLARKIEIAIQPDRGLIVQVQAANATAERKLVERLMQMPEMTSPGVRLEVMVAQ